MQRFFVKTTPFLGRWPPMIDLRSVIIINRWWKIVGSSMATVSWLWTGMSAGDGEKIIEVCALEFQDVLQHCDMTLCVVDRYPPFFQWMYGGACIAFSNGRCPGEVVCISATIYPRLYGRSVD